MFEPLSLHDRSKNIRIMHVARNMLLLRRIAILIVLALNKLYAVEGRKKSRREVTQRNTSDLATWPVQVQMVIGSLLWGQIRLSP